MLFNFKRLVANFIIMVLAIIFSYEVTNHFKSIEKKVVCPAYFTLMKDSKNHQIDYYFFNKNMLPYKRSYIWFANKDKLMVGQIYTFVGAVSIQRKGDLTYCHYRLLHGSKKVNARNKVVDILSMLVSPEIIPNMSLKNSKWMKSKHSHFVCHSSSPSECSFIETYNFDA